MIIILKIPNELRNNPMMLYEKMMCNIEWLHSMGMTQETEYTFYYRYNFEGGVPDEMHYWIHDDRKEVALLLALRGI